MHDSQQPAVLRRQPGPDGADGHALVGRNFGAYRVHKVIGSGAFGTVYEAEHPALKAHVALKVMHPALVSRNDLVQRFRAEARFAAGIKHPNVVQIADVGEEAGVPYIAMELLRGVTLDQMLASERRLAIETAVDIMLSVLSAVATMHARGVLHRDIKPENLFLSSMPDGQIAPKVLDFGVAAHLETKDVDGGVLVGSPSFMSPELTRSQATDARSDLFSLGAVLYEAIAGKPAFPGVDVASIVAAVRAARPVSLRALRIDTPPELEAAVMRALAARPADRFATAVVMGQAIAPFAGVAARRAWDQRHGPKVPVGAPPRPVTVPAPPPERSAPSAPRIVPGAPIGEDARALLRLIPRFASLSQPELDALLICVRWRRLVPGEVLYQENAPGDTMAFIAEGTTRVFSQGEHARHQIAVRGVGTFLGEMTCLDPAPRSATVVAATPALIGELSRDHLRALRGAMPVVASAIMGEVITRVIDRIREVDAQIEAAFKPSVAPAALPDLEESLKAAATTGVVAESKTPAPSGMGRLVSWFRGIR